MWLVLEIAHRMHATCGISQFKPLAKLYLLAVLFNDCHLCIVIRGNGSSVDEEHNCMYLPREPGIVPFPQHIFDVIMQVISHLPARGKNPL